MVHPLKPILGCPVLIEVNLATNDRVQKANQLALACGFVRVDNSTDLRHERVRVLLRRSHQWLSGRICEGTGRPATTGEEVKSPSTASPLRARRTGSLVKSPGKSGFQWRTGFPVIFLSDLSAIKHWATASGWSAKTNKDALGLIRRLYANVPVRNYVAENPERIEDNTNEGRGRQDIQILRPEEV
jgi:hypothetical protein